MNKELGIYINNTIKQIYNGHYTPEAEKVIVGFFFLLSLSRTPNSMLKDKGIEINFNKAAINRFELENPDKLIEFLVSDNIENYAERVTENSSYIFNTAKKGSLLETMIIDLEQKMSKHLDNINKEKERIIKELPEVFNCFNSCCKDEANHKERTWRIGNEDNIDIICSVCGKVINKDK